jgi:2,3-dihydroxyphenylpropionate 1,2-dioxygenase
VTLALCTLSHSPLMTANLPAAEVSAAVAEGLARARAEVAAYDPELVVLFAPDHYNGVFYDLMPPFCIGAAATAVGDFGSLAGPLNVESDAARMITAHVLDSGLDVALSERMTVDHGFAQPLELLFGSLTARPVVPIFLNCVAEPLGPLARIRLLGEAVGQAISTLGRRVLVIGSGGLSHDPPVPRLREAPPLIAERLIAGRNLTPADRAVREERVLAAGREFAAGAATIAPLNPDWDRALMALLAAGDLHPLDAWSNADIAAQAGHSGHEVRSWIAAYAALSTAGPYDVSSSFYRPIPEWIAGFGITTAATRP